MTSPITKTILVTGGSGFVGSALVRHLLSRTEHRVVNLDILTYAADPNALSPAQAHPHYRFERVDICDAIALRRVFAQYQPDVVLNLAAETHVDRSIDGPAAFIQTNVVGTFTLLDQSLHYWRSLGPAARKAFRFVQVSTDEVFGSLSPSAVADESAPYRPNSPYSASKAGSDHLVRAWHRTYGLPTLITNCGNNYGEYQFPEKLIPLMILRGLAEQSLPVYGDGGQVRDWIYVEDHARALLLVCERGEAGAAYNIGARSERTNGEVVELVCELLDRRIPAKCGARRRLIELVADRPGHDRRYALDPSRLEQELGWRATESFESGLARTVSWYVENGAWWQAILKRGYTTERLGLSQVTI